MSTRVKISKTDGYEVSELGEVFFNGTPVKVHALESGYRVVNIKYCHLGWRTITLARLVLEAFVGPKSPKQESRHVNGDPSDCRASNLRWEDRGKNREGLQHKADTLGHALRDKRRKRRQTKQKINELRQLKRQMLRMQEELGL